MTSPTCSVCLIGQCIEGMAVLGYISGRSFKLHQTCQSSVQTKNILLFGKIFRHVVSLVTEISHQDQNFKIIPRTISSFSGISEKICCKWYLDMRGSRNFRQGGPGQSDKKGLTTFFFSPQLTLQKSNG